MKNASIHRREWTEEVAGGVGPPLTDIADEEHIVGFTPSVVSREALLGLCARHTDIAQHERLGESTGGRPIDGFVIGTGRRTVCLMAGNHADEPVGPETLRRLAEGLLEHLVHFGELLERFRFVVIPHTNPDGEFGNRKWMEEWPDFASYVRYAFRDPPGRDLEFGFPGMRLENRMLSDFLREYAPYALQLNLHGMGIAEGAMLLIDRHWSFCTQPLRDGFAAAVRAEGLRLHDHNRRGEKGFFYIEPGFSTTPEGHAMKAYFEQLGDTETAAHFHYSSMEFVRMLGGNPLCVVTEIPLFTVAPRASASPGVPEAYLELRDRLPELKARLNTGGSVEAEMKAFGITPVPIEAAVRLQLRTLELALAAIEVSSKRLL